MSEFMSELSALGPLGAGAIVSLVVVMLLRGSLVTKAQHDRELADRDKRIDKLEQLLETEQGISAEVSKQNTVLLPGTTLANNIAEALHGIADKRST